MHLGFYSELARRDLVKAREFIASHGYTSTIDDIRRFRQDLAAQNPSDEQQQLLTKSPDFYSTSECRDLLFHVREHCLTLGQIESFLAELGLRFIGFELEPRVLPAVPRSALPTTHPASICATGRTLRQTIRIPLLECTNSGFKSRSVAEIEWPDIRLSCRAALRCRS